MKAPMKALTSGMLALALALAIPLATQAAGPVLDAPVVQSAVVDAPVAEVLPSSEQPIFAALQAIDARIPYCIDSGVPCHRDSDCVGVCAPYTCICYTHVNYTQTCVLCP